MGVDNIITFDAHDPRVSNAIPLSGFETVPPTYQFVKGLLRNVKDLQIDSDHMMAISPDEGGTNRAIYLANVLGLDMGMFYKRRDYTQIVNGRNPIVAHEFLGADVKGKDMIIIDDMISSGESMLEVAKLLKDREARNIYMCSTFGLFTSGLEKFDKAYEEGLFTKVLDHPTSYTRHRSLLSRESLHQLRPEQIYRSHHRQAESRRLHQRTAGSGGSYSESQLRNLRITRRSDIPGSKFESCSCLYDKAFEFGTRQT